MNGGAGRGTRAPTTKPQSTAANRGALVPGSSRGRGGGGGGGGGEVSEVGGVRPRQRMTVVPAGSRSVGTAPTYGEIVDSDEVHDEIRDLGNQVKQVIKDHFQRHGTSEEQVLGGIRQFGPSKQSKKILNKENEAAKLAFETGIYAVWRAMEAPKLSGGNQDFCCRIGYRHRCFCGHTLAAHRTPPTPTPGKKMKLPQKYPCEESGCACASFQYVPNEPEEIGEGWLTRRSNWDPAKWSAKCRCGHGHKEHEPAHQRCKSCGCGRFNSHFLCVVCDLPWESHETVFETEAERHRAGFPVREDYFPLSGIDWDVRELVLTDATGGGALQAPSAGSRITGRGANPRVIECSPADEAFAPGNYCRGCATVFRDASSKVCAKCGKAR